MKDTSDIFESSEDIKLGDNIFENVKTDTLFSEEDCTFSDSIFNNYMNSEENIEGKLPFYKHTRMTSDIELKDFSDPVRAKKVLHIIKIRDKRSRCKIQRLQTENLQLKKKVAHLEELFTHIKNTRKKSKPKDQEMKILNYDLDMKDKGFFSFMLSY